MLFSSIFGYFLTLLLAFTLIMFVAFISRVLLVITVSKTYAAFSKEITPQALLKFSMVIVQPIGFLTSIFHGYASVWMGVVILTGLGVTVDFFLGAFLGVSFLFFGLRRLKKPVDVTINDNKNPNEKQLDKDVTLIIDPDLQDKEQSNPMGNMENKIKNQLKGKAQEFIHGNTIVGLIGKLTGVAMATFHYLPLPF